MDKRNWVKGKASGRIDFMGGVADYSGAWVLQAPIRAQTTVKIRYASANSWSLKSRQEGKFAFSEEAWSQLRGSRNLAAARKSLNDVPGWGRYVLGCIAVLLHHEKWPVDLAGPFDVEIDSKVPLGMGVSSSAAIEIATLRALTQLAHLTWSGTELARFAQQAENEIVGAPCGLMDQLAAAYGERRALLPILCRPDFLGTPIRLPAGIAIVGWPSGVKHDVGASPYSTARCGAFMGRKILEAELNRSITHLSEISVSEFAHAAPRLPRIMRGRDFLLKFGHHSDSLTALPEITSQLDPKSEEALDREYPIRPAARFPIEESYRVQLVREILRGLERRGQSDRRKRNALSLVGELLFQSHEGYGRMGLGSGKTDEMVSAIRRFGPDRGFYGARISGGGSGGTVVVLLDESSLPKLEELRLEFQTPYDLIGT
jgi:galactokinase